MPLRDVRCPSGHVTEVLVRGATSAPFACGECGEEATVLPSRFHSQITEPPAPSAPKKRPTNRPKYVLDRAGGGAAARTEEGNYRPALTHNARCPQCSRRRNVAVLFEYDYGKRLCCEACGYIWIHQEATASDPLFSGVNPSFSPGQKFSGYVKPGDQYRKPERAG